ncbi:unnamed protein product [Adineta ricciae]|uniref:Uncharacterized protein n=1 Tax=Adineta ricciae TaxID=249248 RepID=A0A814C1Y6_ADIRI|nr:unnamed protein product [Adineta ricciae]CAF0936577.1 unnamed protein product [Adineta ricciae]
MGVDHYYYPKKRANSSTNCLRHITIPATSSFLYNKSDFIWQNPTELNLLDVKKAPLMNNIDEHCFMRLLPCVRRLYTIFNSVCPNIYRVRCTDSYRVLQEMICLIEEYLHLRSISINDILLNEDYFHSLINKVRLSTYRLPANTHRLASRPEIHCFGQGIHTNDERNQLYQTLLFCFELRTSIKHHLLSPIEVLILDPNKNMVRNNTKYINSYQHGYIKLFSCSYKPITQAGFYTISFYSNSIEVTNDPLTVLIKSSDEKKEQLLSAADMEKINEQDVPSYELEGEGCSTKIIVNSIVRFRLRITSSTNVHTVDSFALSILDPFGHAIVVKRRVLSSDLLELTYQPMSVGAHELSIVFNNKLQRQITIDVKNDEMNSSSKLKPFGPGLKRAIVGCPTEFYVDLHQQSLANGMINQNHLQFSLEPSYHAEIDYEQEMATLRYTPLKEGDCPIHILQYNKDITNSPYMAYVKQECLAEGKPRVQVIGLPDEIIIHRLIEFRVLVENPFPDPMHSLHVEILTPDDESPSVSIRRQQDFSYECSFIPATLGRHLISIDYAGIVPEKNPIYCQAIQEKDIQLTGPAMHNQCLTLNEPTHFYFKLNDFLPKPSNALPITYESGYNSYDDTSLPEPTQEEEQDNDDDQNYRITITDAQGNVKPNISINENLNNDVRVDFTPNEQILFINISCTW